MQNFLRHLNEETVAMESFLQILEQESDTLTQGKFDELPGLTEAKSQLVQRIIELDRQREVMQVALGYDAGQTGAAALVAAGDEEMQTVWQHLLDIAGGAKAANHRNGILIHTNLDFTRQSILFLRNGAHAPSLYGPDGMHRTGRGRSRLVST